MKREIKFRGMGSGEMFYGNLTCVTGIGPGNGVKPGYYINNSAGAPFAYDVDPNTIGQFTGLKDENGVEIYEGDVVICYRYKNNEEHTVIIEDITKLPRALYGSNLNGRRIIGNIYENPELL